MPWTEGFGGKMRYVQGNSRPSAPRDPRTEGVDLRRQAAFAAEGRRRVGAMRARGVPGLGPAPAPLVSQPGSSPAAATPLGVPYQSYGEQSMMPPPRHAPTPSAPVYTPGAAPVQAPQQSLLDKFPAAPMGMRSSMPVAMEPEYDGPRTASGDRAPFPMNRPNNTDFDRPLYLDGGGPLGLRFQGMTPQAAEQRTAMERARTQQIYGNSKVGGSFGMMPPGPVAGDGTRLGDAYASAMNGQFRPGFSTAGVPPEQQGFVAGGAGRVAPSSGPMYGQTARVEGPIRDPEGSGRTLRGKNVPAGMSLRQYQRSPQYAAQTQAKYGPGSAPYAKRLEEKQRTSDLRTMARSRRFGVKPDEEVAKRLGSSSAMASVAPGQIPMDTAIKNLAKADKTDWTIIGIPDVMNADPDAIIGALDSEAYRKMSPEAQRRMQSDANNYIAAHPNMDRITRDEISGVAGGKKDARRKAQVERDKNRRPQYYAPRPFVPGVGF